MRNVRFLVRVGAVGFVSFLLVLLVWQVVHRDSPPKVGDPAPTFDLKLFDASGHLSLSSLRGHAVLVNFWTSSCVPCRQEERSLEALSRKWATDGVVVVGVDPTDLDSTARKFLREYDVTYPNVHDVGSNVADRYGVDGTPESFFVSRSGRIVGSHIIGPVNAPYNEPLVSESLREAISSS